ncbi:hypothetical protein HDR58_00430 [bacterium]|nr:hypothetical protein [bacterium]
MEIRSIQCQCPQKNSNPTFGSVKYESAKKTLNAVLNLEQVKEFKKIVDAHEAKNKIGQVILFGEGKKLSANVFPQITSSDGKSVSGALSQHSQRFFESTLSFVKRMCKVADKRTKEFMEKVEKSKLLNEEI